MSLSHFDPLANLRITWNPAREIKREELGNLSPGNPTET